MQVDPDWTMVSPFGVNSSHRPAKLESMVSCCSWAQLHEYCHVAKISVV